MVFLIGALASVLTGTLPAKVFTGASAHAEDLLPGESLPESSKSRDLSALLESVKSKLPQETQSLINEGKLGVTLAEIEPDSKKRGWASLNGSNTLCAASTLKIFCAVAAFEAEARGYLTISDTEPTTPSHVRVANTIININDIKSSVLYTSGPAQGNVDAGKVCAAANDAYLRKNEIKNASDAFYRPCFTNLLLKEWGLQKEISNYSDGISLGTLYASKRKCDTMPAAKSFGLTSLTTQRASADALTALWTAIELEEFPKIKRERMAKLKQTIFAGEKSLGRIGKAFCQSASECHNKYGKTGTLNWRSQNVLCYNDSRVIEYPKSYGKKLVISVLCNDTLSKSRCRKNNVIENISKLLKTGMEERWSRMELPTRMATAPEPLSPLEKPSRSQGTR